MRFRICIIVIVIAFAVLMISCKSITTAVDIGAQIAGTTGAIGSSTAAAISQSARAIGNAAEEITPEAERSAGRHSIADNSSHRQTRFTAATR
ncbi:MAG: hypothetical protein FWD40_04520 [Treponema sp.]|nr:hypothetical protein [Treponema sp.]